MLVVLWNEPFHRPTQDIDFAAQGTVGRDDIVPALQHVCRIAAADGVVFGADHMTVSRIRGATDEGGIRIRLPATVDVARVTVQVDVGFGDSIQPPPADAECPSLLDTVASRVLAYPNLHGGHGQDRRAGGGAPMSLATTAHGLVELDGGHVALVLHHGFTPAASRKAAMARTVPRLVAGAGCGRCTIVAASASALP